MRQDEKGFTLINLIVVIAISAIMASGAGIASSQIVKGSQRNNDLATATCQAQNVGYRVSQDALMAQTINIGDDPETTDDEFITLDWMDWETGDIHNIRYVWLDSADPLKSLKRKELVHDKDGAEISNETTLVATNIYTAGLSEQDDAWRLSVETRSGEKSLTIEYVISQRLGQ